MIRSVLSNNSIKKLFGLFVVIFMLVPLFTSIEESNKGESVALPQPETYYSIEGIVSYQNDSSWKEIIRQIAFDEGAITLDLYSGNTCIKNVELQSYSVDDDFHMSFVHDGDGGGNFVISNIPSVVDSKEITKCVISIDNVPHYVDLKSRDIEFSASNTSANSVNMFLEPKYATLNIREQVIGEDENIATEFSVKVTATNTNSSIEVASTAKSNTYKVTKDTVNNKKGTSIQVPVGLEYTVSQVERDDYAVTGYNVSCTGTNTSGKEQTVVLQSDVLSVSKFKIEDIYSNMIVSKYDVVIENAAKNVQSDWKLQWLDNHSKNRPEPTFRLLYSIEGSPYAEVTQSVLDKLGMDSMPMYSEVSSMTTEDIVTYKYNNLSSVTTDGKVISYKVEQTTVSDDYIMEYNASTNTFTNTIRMNFVATIKWLDSDVNIDEVRPKDTQIKEYLRLYRYIDDEYEEVELDNNEIVFKKDGENNKLWTVIIDKDLPQYSSNNNKYTYVLIEGSLDENGKVVNGITEIKKDGYKGEEQYEVSYYNEGSTEVKSDRCYSEQIILHILDSEVEYSATKVWKDGEDATRPETIVTLWRYPMKNSSDTEISIAESARVIAYDNNGDEIILSYTLETSGKDVSDVTTSDKYRETIVFDSTTVKGLAEDFVLPKYDPTGNEYIYFVVETVDNPTLGTYYDSVYKMSDGKVSDIGVGNDGVITSIRAGRIAVEVNKLWNAASAAEDLEDTDVTFRVLGKSETSTSYKELQIYDGSSSIVDFGTTKLRDNTEIIINPYDSNGKKYEDIVVQEATITVNGSRVSISYNTQDKSVWSFNIGGNTYEGKSGALTKKGHSVFYDTELYGINIVNTITTKAEYGIIVSWDSDIDPADRVTQTLTVVGTSIKYMEDGSEPPKVTYELQINNDAGYDFDGSLRGSAILTNTITGEKYTIGYTEEVDERGDYFWLVDPLPGLNRYDKEGYLIDYRVEAVKNHVSEGDIVDWGTAFNTNAEGSWIRNTRINDEEEYIMGTKVWNDAGDVASRYNVEIVVTDRKNTSISRTIKINASKFWHNFIHFDEEFFPDGIAPGMLDIKEVLVGPDGTRYEPYEKDVDGDGKKETYITTDLFTYKVDMVEEDISVVPEGMQIGQVETNVLGITFTNTRVDTVDIEIKNEWKDGEDQTGKRPDSITFVVNQYDIYGRKTGTFTKTLTDEDEVITDGNDMWASTMEDLPKYDEYGRRYDYYIDTIPTYGTNDSTGEYKVSLNYKFEFGESVPSNIDGYKFGDKKVDDKVTYTCTNQLYATTEFRVYQKWYDEAMSNEERPDIYLTVYRRSTGEEEGGVAGTGDVPITTSYKNQVWTAGGSNAYYTWAIDFLYLDKYDENGYEYEYYVTEIINNTEDKGLKYRIDYREGAVDGPLIEEKIARANDYIINTLQDTVVINGEKIWKNIAGYAPTDLPDAEIELYRKHPADADTVPAKLMGSVLLEDGETLFSFKTYVNDEGKTVELEKYTEYGQSYIYTIQEKKDPIIKPGECIEGDLYTITRVNNTIINEFNRTTNTRDIVVTKKWNRDKVYNDPAEDVYPSVTLKLYRYLGDTTSTSSMTLVDTVTVSGDKFKAVDGAPYDIKFDNVLIYSPKGDRYNYFVQESSIAAYTTEYAVEEGAVAIEATENGIFFKDEIRITDENKISKGSITNTYVPTYDLKVQGYKEWDDYFNYYKLRPKSINIVLSRNTTSAGGSSNVSTIRLPLKTEDDPTLDKNNDIYVLWNYNATSTGNDMWIYTIYNLPGYAANGQSYNYTVREDDEEVEKYYTSSGAVSSNARNANSSGVIGMNRITNKFSQKCVVKKHWIDGNNEYNFRPKSVTMKLQSSIDGGVTWQDVLVQQEGSTDVITQVITNETKYVIPNTRNNSWTYTFKNLPSKLKIEDTEATNAVKDAVILEKASKEAQEELEKALKSLEDARASFNAAQDTLNLTKKVKEAYDTAVAAQEVAQSAYDAAVAVRDGAQDVYDNANNTYTLVSETYNTLRDKYNTANEEVVTAQTAFDKAKAEYDAIKDDDTVSEEDKTKAAEMVTQIGNALKAAQATCDSLRTDMELCQIELANAIDARLVAKKDLDDAEVSVTEALEVLNTAKAATQTAKEAVDNSDVTSEEAEEAFDAASEALTQAEEAHKIATETASDAKDAADAQKIEALKYVDELPTSVDDVEPIFNATEVMYKCVETKIGNSEIPEGSNQVGSYVMSVVSTANNETQIKNSMQSTKLNLTKVWDDVDNYYQTRFNETHYRIERVDQSKQNEDGTFPEDAWEQVCDIDGKPLVLNMTSSNATKDANGKYNLWNKTFYNLPVAREGNTDIGEPKIVQLYYRAVECTNDAKNPQLVSVKQGSDGKYTIEPTATYQHYVDITDYPNEWWNNDSANTNYTTVTNHMITKEDVNEDIEDKLVSTIEAEKQWRKDTNYSNYDVVIELKRSVAGGSYISFPTKLTKVIVANGDNVSWDHMPAYDKDGNTVNYKAEEITTNYWFRCETQLTTTEETAGKRDLYTFINIQQMNYYIYKYWENNNRMLPKSESYFTSNIALEKKITADGEWQDVLDRYNNPVTYFFSTWSRTQYSNSASTGLMDKYTVDNERIYYRAVETHINGVPIDENKAYTSKNVDAELDGDVYTDNGESAIYNTVRTESLNITKVWDDDNDCDGVRPAINSSKMKMTLYADYGSGYNVVPTDFYSLSWTQDPDDDNKWHATINNLPKYNKTGSILISYKISETTVPARYFVSKDAEIPTFEDGVDSYDYSISNTLTLLLKLRKYDGVNNKLLAGTQFNLYKELEGGSTQQVGGTLTAGSDGYISFEMNQPGNFVLVETKAVKGYEYLLDRNGEPDLVNGSPFMCFFTVADNNLRQTIIINDSNCYQQFMGGEPASVSNDEYTAAVAPPENTKQGVRFEINEGWYDLVTSYGLINKRKLGELTSIKRDKNTSKALDGIVFELYRYENENGTGNTEYLCDVEAGKGYICSTTGDLVVTETGTSTSAGILTISKLPWGKYVLKEVSTLTGYVLPGSTWTFVVNADTVNTSTGINENIVVKYGSTSTNGNALLNEKTVFQFIKRGYNNIALTGGNFKIVSNDDARTEQKFWKNIYTDDESLKVTELKPNDYVYGLPVGSYRIVEVDVPYGYKPAEDVVFSINEYGWIINANGVNTNSKYVTMYDAPVVADIINVDEDFITPINGSTFELTGQFANSTGSAILETSTKVHKISNFKWAQRANLIPSEPDGKKYVYKVQQTAVPSMYELQSQIFYFIINENYQIELTDENGNKPSEELQEIYDVFLKVDNEASVPSIIFENLRIPVNDIYIENGEAYIDMASSQAVKLFYAYDTKNNETKLGEPIKFYVDKSNLGLLEFAVTTSSDGTDKTKYVDSAYLTIYDSKGNEMEAEDNMYRLKEMEKYTLHISKDYLNSITTGSRMLYIYSHMPRIDDIEGVYIVRRTAFEEH